MANYLLTFVAVMLLWKGSRPEDSSINDCWLSCVATGLFCGYIFGCPDKSAIYRCPYIGANPRKEIVCDLGQTCKYNFLRDDECGPLKPPNKCKEDCRSRGLICGYTLNCEHPNALYNCAFIRATPKFHENCNKKKNELCIINRARDDQCMAKSERGGANDCGTVCFIRGKYCGERFNCGRKNALYYCQYLFAPPKHEKNCGPDEKCVRKFIGNDQCDIKDHGGKGEQETFIECQIKCRVKGLHCGVVHECSLENALYRCYAPDASPVLESKCSRKQTCGKQRIGHDKCIDLPKTKKKKGKNRKNRKNKKTVSMNHWRMNSNDTNFNFTRRSSSILKEAVHKYVMQTLKLKNDHANKFNMSGV